MAGKADLRDFGADGSPESEDDHTQGRPEMNSKNGRVTGVFDQVHLDRLQRAFGTPVTVTAIAELPERLRQLRQHDTRKRPGNSEQPGNSERPGLDRPLVTVVSSRLGLDPHVHRTVCRFLTRSMLDCRQRDATILVADGSAIDPWLTRAAELFGIPAIRVTVGPPGSIAPQDLSAEKLVIESAGSGQLCRDAVVIAMADRVDAVHVRRGGKIAGALNQRLRNHDDATTRVAISQHNHDGAVELIQKGAIGWYCSTALMPRSVTDSSGAAKSSGPTKSSADCEPANTQATSTPTSDDKLDWAHTEGLWLVHHTRGRHGPWPGETESQYLDSMLLSQDDSVSDRGPLKALIRIIRSERLVGSAVATDRRFPVVCLSAQSLKERLQSRCYRPHLKRWDCEPYGIAIRIDVAKKLGAVPVTYGKPHNRQRLAPDQRYRFQSIGKTYDWTTEREWRVQGDLDLSDCGRRDVRIFVPSTWAAEKMPARCRWKISCVAPFLRSDAIIAEQANNHAE